MLKAKYYHGFKGCKNCILIIGDTDSYRAASLYFSGLNSGFLAPSDYIQLEHTNEIEGNSLLLTKDECLSFAKISLKLANSNIAAHEYFSIKSMPEIELLVSCREYEFLP